MKPSGAYFTANAVVDKTAAALLFQKFLEMKLLLLIKRTLKMAPLVKRLAMTGKKGDVIHIPKPIVVMPMLKAEATAVTIQVANT